MKRVALLVVAAALAAPAAAAASNFDPNLGFRTGAHRVYCFMEFQGGGGAWSGHVCFRTSDGAFAALRGPMLSNTARIRVQRGRAGAFRGFRKAGVRLFGAGRTWSSSDAEIVTCRIRAASVTCRHWRGASFTLTF